MRLKGLNIIGVDMIPDGIDIDKVYEIVKSNKVKMAYITPSYHNPTGITMTCIGLMILIKVQQQMLPTIP